MIENLTPLADWAISWAPPVPLLTIYIVALVVGGGMLVISSLFGGHAGTDVQVDGDFSFSGDVHADVPSDVHVDPSGGTDGAFDGVAGHGHEWFSLTSWFSISFVVYFLAVFGLVGTSLTYLSDVQPNGVAALAVIGGLIAGQAVHHLLRLLRRTSGNSAPNVAEYVNRPACVTIAIDGHRKGEVAVSVRGGTRFIPATARQAETRFEKGDRVVIVELNDATAEVVAHEEYVSSRGSEPV
jgi:membrane protein implicated in regulation of membrane protease activity